MLAAFLVPEGPLHPGEAFAAFTAGVVMTSLLRDRARSWPAGAVAVAVGMCIVWLGTDVVSTFVDRPRPLIPLFAMLVVVGLAAWAASYASSYATPVTITVAVLAATAMVWGTVPDTEAAVIVGMSLLGMLVVPPVGRWSIPWIMAIAALPLAAGVIGSVGRPDRFGLAIGRAVPAAVIVGLIAVFSEPELRRRLRRPAHRR